MTKQFAGFLANPAALERGGRTVQAGRGQQRRGLLERLAQTEVNRALRREIQRKAERKSS